MHQLTTPELAKIASDVLDAVFPAAKVPGGNSVEMAPALPEVPDTASVAPATPERAPIRETDARHPDAVLTESWEAFLGRQYSAISILYDLAPEKAKRALRYHIHALQARPHDVGRLKDVLTPLKHLMATLVDVDFHEMEDAADSKKLVCPPL